MGRRFFGCDATNRCYCRCIEIQEENQEKARKRIFVEHVIRLIKIFGIARERFRLKDNNYQKVILTICGLVRLRIGSFILV